MRTEICQFLGRKEKDPTKLQDERFLREPSHLDVLSLQLQGRGHVITDAEARAFKNRVVPVADSYAAMKRSFLCCQSLKEPPQLCFQVHTFVYPAVLGFELLCLGLKGKVHQ